MMHSLFLTTTFALLPLTTLAQPTGTLSILTMNVAGLPAILNNNDVPGDKADNANQIGTYFATYGYDIINVQEDFNYHAYIYETDNHTYRTATSGGVPFGSGLNTLANYPWDESTFSRTKWNTCNLNSGDCLTPKGFTYMRMTIAETFTVDVYNLHTDAGDDSGDITARASNLQQVADYISANSEGQPVLVFGDTNSRYTRTGDGIRIFSTQNSLADAWVELEMGGVEPTEGSDALVCENPSPIETCEIVDKVLYRSGHDVGLTAVSFEYAGDKFLQSNGSVLSDHDPVLVQFEWTVSA
ncbi:hypothetical protein M409DRAFT_26492 [Zasmidium cellare ATCC 36951]|uniref:Inositol polyphosphate-related phosphatase domain-containing protein n=1 Tax=Zasmidium cellare ATCC 36951 TaxID=1080233 RepID=A0A6A6CC68_ZASCE|nr:uncharacterized protein M409DRAFT_26492 [Zasmidium cellare ATCC 36951]KAF2163046.1 hypothetical protein M409DRAFT_26492 [Zasmidium cellare ATCC 36951]